MHASGESGSPSGPESINGSAAMPLDTRTDSPPLLECNVENDAENICHFIKSVTHPILYGWRDED
jgi:hypothetical protein